MFSPRQEQRITPTHLHGPCLCATPRTHPRRSRPRVLMQQARRLDTQVTTRSDPAKFVDLHHPEQTRFYIAADLTTPHRCIAQSRPKPRDCRLDFATRYHMDHNQHQPHMQPEIVFSSALGRDKHKVKEARHPLANTRQDGESSSVRIATPATCTPRLIAQSSPGVLHARPLLCKQRGGERKR